MKVVAVDWIALPAMRKLLALAAASLLLIAAAPEETIDSLEATGSYIENGSSASEQVVSDAVFDGRAAGGRLYIVVLAEEPAGGATTFADTTLDLLEVEGYVVVVAPETVGYAATESVWSVEHMDAAVDRSLDGGTDDDVIGLFIDSLTSDTAEPESGASGSPGGISVLWLLVVGVAVVGFFVFMSRRGRARRTLDRITHIKGLASQKLDEVANDILEMEDEVTVSGNVEVKSHYQAASALYATAIEENERAVTTQEMMDVSEKLDLAIWRLDCAEALLDGKPQPAKPEPPQLEPITPPSPEPKGNGEPARAKSSVPDFNRRPQRRSTGSGDMLNVLLTMIAASGMRGRGGGFGGFGGSSGGWTGSGGGAPRPPMSGGGGRIRGGGRRRG